jgi:hypothetical protein
MQRGTGWPTRSAAGRVLLVVTMWRRLWLAVRYRLLVLACMAVVVGGFAVALRGSVHLGPAPSYEHTVFFEPYMGSITAWQLHFAGLGGWVENRTDTGCASLTLWAHWGIQGWDLDYQNGWIALGAVPAHSRLIWTGYLRDVNNRLVYLHGRPSPPDFNCEAPTST